MYREKRILGVITARGGSKGIPRKNIKELLGRPLIAYTIEAASRSRRLTKFIVSTDDSKIQAIAKGLGAEVPFLRPAEISGDDSRSLDAVRHALLWLEERGEKYDYVMILQPTSPLRTAEDIDKSIEKIVETGADSVMSMVELVDMSLKKLKIIENDLILPYAKEEGRLSAFRKEGVKVYKRNCAIYLTRVEWIKKASLFGKISRPYIMPPERSIDINEPADFEMAEFWINRKKI